MFVDEKELTIQAGKGGDGAALFRREKYANKGGPDGGDGGNGGQIYTVGKHNLHTITHLAHVEKIKADDGARGGHRQATGKSGKDRVIDLPLGTVIYRKQDGDWKEETEITEEGRRYLLAKGGSGGWGNWHFRTSVQQAPDRFNPGLPGEEKRVKLILKLIADVGLIGLPNAGKSTLLAAVTAAHPKIAAYPFTTIEPQLGVAEVGKKKAKTHLVLADLPGLIAGASQGKGLGITFLKHIERTTKLLHCLSAEYAVDQLIANYQTVRQELAGWSKDLTQKPELLVLTKVDLLSEEEIQIKTITLAKALKKEVRPISATRGQGLKELLTSLSNFDY